MSAEEFLALVATMIVINVAVLILNAAMFVRNFRMHRHVETAKAQLPRLVRAGEIIDARPGEHIALEIIVPPLPPPPQPTHPAGGMVH